jgi:hypothetical protein
MFIFDINLCYTMIEGRPRKIRNLKYGGEIIKNKEGSETAELLSTDAG